MGGSLSISNCTISNNSSKSSPGGGIDFETLTPHPGTFTLTNSTVSGNTLTNSDPTAFIGGAGVHVQAMSGSTVTMTGDTFTNNIATGSGVTGPVGGGGLWLEGGATVTASTFTGNQANGPVATLAGGGAINLATGSTQISFSRIVGNSATHGPGGVENNGAEAVTTATRNWWGCNAGPGITGTALTTKCDEADSGGTGSGVLTVNPRLTLTATANPTKLVVPPGVPQVLTATVTAALTHDSNGLDTSASGHLPDGITVAFAGTLGTASPTSQTSSGGTATTQFTPSGATGSGGTDVTVDGQKVTASIGMGVPPLFSSAQSAIFSSGSPNTFSVTATGTPAPTYSESGSLPGGVTLNGTTGALAGTPPHGSEGSYPITLTATNGYGTDATQSFTLTVVLAPAITSASSYSFTEGVAGSFTVTGTGTPPLSFSEAGQLPGGVSLDSTTGVLAGTPAPNSHGTYLITLSAHNTGSPDATQAFTLTVGLPPVITSAAATTLTAGSAGSFQVTATGYPAPTFTENGALPSGVTLNPTTGVLGGTPGAHSGGPYSITVTASNGFTPDASQPFILTVDEAPAITSGTSTTFTAGTPGSFAVTWTGYPAATFTETGALPSGVSLDPTTGALSGTAAAHTGGTYGITVTASNGVSPDATQGFTLTVDEAPAITSGTSTTFIVGQPGTFTVTAGGFPAPTFSESGALPSGVSLDANTGVLSGTPGVGTAAQYPITLTAHNSVLPDATQGFTLTVKPLTQPPAITSAGSTGFTEGSAGSFTVTGTGIPALTFSETGALPQGVSLDSTTGVLAGTPAPNSHGTYLITLTASNGVSPDATQAFTLTVGLPPVITSAAATTLTAGSSGSFAVTATGYPAPTFSETGTLPSGISLNPTTGALGGTPAALTGGTYGFTVTASNGFAPDATQAFTLTVNEAPAIISGNATTFTVGTAGSFPVTFSGFPAPTVSVTAGTLPAGVTLGSGGALTGTPASHTGGSHTVTLTATNGVGADATQQFTLTVNEAAAFSSADHTTFTAGTAGSFGLTASGFPASSFSETGSLPSGVTLAGGVLSGTPDAGTGGIYDLTLTAHNGVGGDDHQAFILTVDEAPSITSADHSTFTVGATDSLQVTAKGTPAPTLQLGSGAVLPAGVTFDTGTGILSATPAAHAGGTYTFDIVAKNGIGSDAVQHLTLTVNEAPAITSAPATTFVVGTPGSFTVVAGGFPAPVLSESLTDTLPGGVTFDPTTGVLAGTPAPSSAADYTLHFTAHNSTLPDATQSFVLHVYQVPAFTSDDHITLTVGTFGTLTVQASGFPAPTLSLSSGTLPSGVTFNAGTGTLSGTPAAGTGNLYTLTFTASNGVQPDAVQTFTLPVDEAPAITSPTSASFTTGAPGTHTVHATGYPAASLTLGGDKLPTGVSFTAATGVLSGTPAAGTGGIYHLTFSASNLIAPDATQAFTLTVDQAPAFTSLNNATFTVGSLGSSTVAATGFPVPALSESPNDTLPTGVTFNAGTGVLSGTPAAGTGGIYTLTFTASNQVGPGVTQTFTLTVTEAPAIISPASTILTTGTAGSFSVTATGWPVPTFGNPGTLPAGIGFDTTTGQLSGTPVVGSAGDYPLTFSAQNGIGTTATQNFTLTVKNGTATSIASSKLHSVLNQPVTFTATVVAGAGTPGGKVLFMNGSTMLGAGSLALVSGVATATYTTAPTDLTAGFNSITAVYSGDATNTTSTSAVLTQVVTNVTTVTVTPHSHTMRGNGTSHTSVTALVTDAGGQPVAGDTVSFTNLPGGGLSVSPATAITDVNGIASITATASTTAGKVTITATEGFGNVQGTATEKLLGVKFKAHALTTTHIPADGSSTTVASVLVVDGGGAPVTGEPVTFQTEGHPGDATLAQPSVLTDSSGVASDTVTSSTTAGAQAITVSDTIGDPAGDFSTVLALTQLPAAGSTNSSFIHNAYVTLLGRDADPDAYAFWLNLLDHGTPRTALTASLASSAEYRRDVIAGTSTVPGLYQQYLGRPADPGAVVFWLGLMAAGGSFEQVRLGLLGSTEYPLRHGNDPAATIEALYEDVLGRPSDPTGKAYWLANYNTATVATQFIHSAEGRAHLVSVLYGSILNRTPDSAGLSYFTQQLLNGATDEYVIGALLASDEYFLTH
jgi:hypothetical protein